MFLNNVHGDYHSAVNRLIMEEESTRARRLVVWLV